MQHRVKWLVERISSPHVALRLRKEEVCLAVGALGRLATPEIVADVKTAMLRQRMLQFLPTCTSMELGMMASGAMTMRWCDASFLDQTAARILAIGNNKPTNVSFEGSGSFLLAAGSTVWRDCSVAARHCASFLARQVIQRENVILADVDNFACAVLGTFLLVLRPGSFPQKDDIFFSQNDCESLLAKLVSGHKRLSDWGVGVSIAACLLALNAFPSCDVLPTLLTLVRFACDLNLSNPLSVQQCLLGVVSLSFLEVDDPIKEKIFDSLVRSLNVIQATEKTQVKEMSRTDEILLSIGLFANILHHASENQKEDDKIPLLEHFLPTDNRSIPPLCISLVDFFGNDLGDPNSNQLLSSIMHSKNALRRFTGSGVEEATLVLKETDSTVYRFRDASVFLFMQPVGSLRTETLVAAISMACASNMRDPAVLQALANHMESLISRDDELSAKRMLSAFGGDAAKMSLMGVSEELRTRLFELSQRSDNQLDVSEVPLPQQFKKLKERGEVVSDALLMSVLEAVDEWSAGDIAYFVAAAPDKCVEFDMLVEKLSSGLSELTAEQLGCVLEAVSESAALALSLHDATLAQTAEIAGSIGLDAPPLVSSLVRLFVNTFSSSPDEALLQQRDELKGLIDDATRSAIDSLSSAGISTTCSLLKAFRLCPTLALSIADVCWGHLLSFVTKGNCSFDELLDMLWAMDAVDTVPVDLIDEIVPQLERYLRNGASKDASKITQFFDLCVRLDTSELDTLFQLVLGDFVNQIDTGRITFTPKDVVSALKASLSLRHADLGGRLLSQLNSSISISEMSCQSLNAVVTVLGGQSSNSSDLSFLCNSATVRLDEIMYLIKSMLDKGASLSQSGAMNELSLTPLFNAVSKLMRVSYFFKKECPPKVIIPESLIDCIGDRIDSLTGSDVADIISSLPFFDVNGENVAVLLQMLITRLSHECDKCSSQMLSTAVFSLGELDGRIGSHVTHHAAVDKLSEYCVDNVGLWNSGRDICRLLYGFSRIACNKRSLYNVFGTQLGKRPLLMLLTREDISLVMSAFGNAKYLDKELYDALAEHMVGIADDLVPADLTLVLSGYSRLNLLNNNLYKRLGERVISVSEEIPSDAAVKILCAYGHVSNENDAVAESLLVNISKGVSQLNSNQCVDALYATAQMNYNSDTDLLDVLASRISDDKSQLTAESIEKVCELSQELNWRNEMLLRAVGDRSVQLTQQLELTGNMGLSSKTARFVLDTLSFFMIHHSSARNQLSDSARLFSRDPSVVAEIAAKSGTNDAGRLEE